MKKIYITKLPIRINIGDILGGIYDVVFRKLEKVRKNINEIERRIKKFDVINLSKEEEYEEFKNLILECFYIFDEYKDYVLDK